MHPRNETDKSVNALVSNRAVYTRIETGMCRRRIKCGLADMTEAK